MPVWTRIIRYLRLKYPTVVDMALAASAPIKLDSVGLVDPLKYYRIVTDAAEKIKPGCVEAVRSAFVELREASPSAAREALGLCQAPTVTEFGWNDLEFWITQYFATMAMFNCRLLLCVCAPLLLPARRPVLTQFGLLFCADLGLQTLPAPPLSTGTARSSWEIRRLPTRCSVASGACSSHTTTSRKAASILPPKLPRMFLVVGQAP